MPLECDFLDGPAEFEGDMDMALSIALIAANSGFQHAKVLKLTDP